MTEPKSSSQIKSRERVRDLAEVFTNEREVDAMLELIPDMLESIDTTFLEPACGDGNFLVGIFARKLALIEEGHHGGTENWFDMAVLRAAGSIYAIDISDENVIEARERMTQVAFEEFTERARVPSSAFWTALKAILEVNVVSGDALDGVSEVRFFEWKLIDGERFIRTPFSLEETVFDLFYEHPEPLAPVHYSDLELGTDQ